jgi:DNA-binding winged helix-turn-helix (wHTH) protein
MAFSMTNIDKSRLRFGPFLVDRQTRELWKGGVRIKLGGQPFEILATLLERPGELVTRDQLRKRIWSEDTFVDFSHGLNAAVNKLREALNDSADEPRYIETLLRRGYRFIAPVETITSVPLIAIPPPAAVSPQPTFSAPEALWKEALNDQEWESTVPIKRHTLVQLSALVTAIVLFALGIAGAWWKWSSRSPGEAELRLKRAAENSIAAIHSAPAPRANSPESVHKAGAERVGPSGKAGAPPDLSDDPGILRLERSNSEGLHKFSREWSASNSPAILRLDLTKGLGFTALTPIVAGSEAIGGPQPSPDGSKLVFMAGRTDAMDLWVCNSDGSSPRKLTNTRRAGTPRWSPDGRWIAFDSDGRYGRSGIYVVSVDGGPARAVVEEESNNSVPSWSRDGKYIYFASNRGSGWEGDQVWRVPAEGGQPFQITRQGGFSAYESMDGQSLYYAKSRYQNPEIWQVPVNGGTETKVPLLHPTTWASWALTNKGILLLSEYSGQASELQYFDFATRSVHSLATLEKASFWLASSAKGSSIWYSELTDSQAQQVFKAGMD